MVTLWPFQVAPVQEIRGHFAKGVRRVLFQMATGAGKGTVATYIIEHAIAKAVAGGRTVNIVFLVNRKLLVNDMSLRLQHLGIQHGVIMADDPRRRPWCSVHVASVDTLHRRTTLPSADILIIDEAHHAASPIFRKVLDRYPKAAVIGLSATPCRLDRMPLDMFDVMVRGPSVAELIAVNAENRSQGVVPIKVFAPSKPDKMRVRAGEFVPADVHAAMAGRKLVGNILDNWLKYGRGRPTIGWACDKANAKDYRDVFLGQGIRAGYMDDSTPLKERVELLAKLRRYELEVIWSIDVLGYGVDAPEVSCGIDAFPTLSLAKWLQRVGRLARALPNKEYSIYIDHAGNTGEVSSDGTFTRRHGFFEDEREWSLSGEQGVCKAASEEPPSRMCKQCWFYFPPWIDNCPECGAPYVTNKRELQVVAGDLQEIVQPLWYKCEACGLKGRLPKDANYTIPCPRCEMGPLRKLGSKYDSGADETGRKAKFMEYYMTGHAKGYKPAWAAMRYKAIYNQWPPRAWSKEAENLAVMAEVAEPVGMII